MYILFYSKRKDNIFVNFVGHGTSGILAFPDVYLYADELNITLQSMYDNNKFENVCIFFIISIGTYMHRFNNSRAYF